MAGRKPKPTALKKLEGNPGKRKLNAKEPVPAKGMPDCPKWLLPEAKEEWKRLCQKLSDKNATGLAIATEEYGSKFFANGAAPSGVLEHPGTIKDPSKVRESWQATFGGSGNANKIAVLEEGMKYTPISISPEQAQFLETRKFQIDEIARIFRVPPHMIGDLEKSSFNNIEQQSLEFVKYTLDPWVSRWEQAMVRALLTPDEKKKYFFKFNVDGLLRGDYQSRMNGYATARQNGWMSANDIRELENLDRISAEDGGDLYLVNGNMLPLQLAGAAYERAPAEPQVSWEEDEQRSERAFSVPDEGPLTDYESWMPDFMKGLAHGIEESRGLIENAMDDVASDMIISPKVTPALAGASGAMINAGASGQSMVSAIREAVQGLAGQSGDIVIPVYLGGTLLDEVIVNAQQSMNLRSGGR